MKLNEQQVKAVNHINGPALVSSVPGSGKTTVIVERTAKLIENGINPKNLLCLTFTNKAAKEMSNRIVKKIGSDNMRFFIGTFHALCASILRKYGSKIGYSKQFTIFDQKNQEEMIFVIGKSMGLEKQEINVYSIMNNVNNWRENLESDEDLLNRFQDHEIYFDIAKKYLETIKEQNIIDFSGLLSEIVCLFDADKILLSKFQEKMKYILVDEFQDTNFIQFYLVNLIGDKHKNIFIVGDIDQSLYAFRNARYKNITDFLSKHKDCKHIPLGKNYRSTPQIIKHADRLIKNNSTHIDCKFETDNPSGSPVYCNKFQNPSIEAVWIADRITELVNEYGWDYSDCAILYRLNYLSLELQTAFSNSGIPFTVIGGPSFFDRREIRDCLAMLKFLINSSDSMSFHRIANLFSGIGNTTINKIETIAKNNNMNILDACKNMEKFCDKRTIKKVAEKISNSFDFDFSNINIGDCLCNIVDYLDYYNILETKCPNDYQDRILNVKELINSATVFGQNNSGIEKYLQNIALITTSDKENDDNSVSLQTIHSAKGTEKNIIFVIGVEQGIMPHHLALKESKDKSEALEEETRILYVGLTRAKKHLFVSYNINRRFRNKQGVLSFKPSFPSQFLYECGLMSRNLFSKKGGIYIQR